MPNIASINDYQTFLIENTLVDNQFLPGYFYTYHYDYRQDMNKFLKYPKSVRDFFDGRPLIYLINRYLTKDGKSKMARGVNLHYMPIPARRFWIDALAKVSPGYMEREQRIIIPQDMVPVLTRKTSFALKQYDINKVKYIRRVPFSVIKDLINFIPPTHEGKSYDEIASEYRLFQPDTRIIKG
tara:strand:+ start:487 stop:1035 length:549 start_codon:yes stop_codon:yes gene_type:complete